MTTTTTPTLRERKKARTRQTIAEAALALFLARGFDDTTVDMIAEAAEISRRTFFRYFETKEAAFFANQEERLELFRARLAEVGRQERPTRAIQRVCLEMAAIYMAEREITLGQHQVIESSRSLKAYDQQLDESWERAIFDALAAGGLSRFRARVIAGALIGTVRAVLRGWFRAGATDDLVELGRRAFAILDLDD